MASPTPLPAKGPKKNKSPATVVPSSELRYLRCAQGRTRGVTANTSKNKAGCATKARIVPNQKTQEREKATIKMDKAFSDKFEKLLEDVAVIKGLCSEWGMLKEEVAAVRVDTDRNSDQIKRLTKENAMLRSRVDEMDQYSRKCNVIIQGIPSKEKENLLQVVKFVATKVKVDLQDYHVCAVHRLPSKKEIDPIIIRLNNLHIKTALIAKAKKMKLNASDLGMGTHPIFVDEHLTAQTIEMLKEARKLRDLGQFEQVWCWEGKVFVRDVEGQPRRRILSMQDLRQVGSRKRNLDVRSPEADGSSWSQSSIGPTEQNKKQKPENTRGSGGDHSIRQQLEKYSSPRNIVPMESESAN